MFECTTFDEFYYIIMLYIDLKLELSQHLKLCAPTATANVGLDRTKNNHIS